MAEAIRTSIRRFTELGDASCLGESVSEGGSNPWSQLINRKMTLTVVDRRITAIVSPLSSEIEALIKPVKEFSERLEHGH